MQVSVLRAGGRKPYRQLTTSWVSLAAVPVVALGAGLLYLSGRGDLWTGRGVWAVFWAQLGTALTPTSAARLHAHRAEDLHEKGLLGDGWYIGGSMNFTYSGVHLLEEAVTYTTDPTIVAETRLSYLTRWGGVPPRVDADEA